MSVRVYLIDGKKDDAKARGWKVKNGPEGSFINFNENPYDPTAKFTLVPADMVLRVTYRGTTAFIEGDGGKSKPPTPGVYEQEGATVIVRRSPGFTPYSCHLSVEALASSASLLRTMFRDIEDGKLQPKPYPTLVA